MDAGSSTVFGGNHGVAVASAGSVGSGYTPRDLYEQQGDYAHYHYQAPQAQQQQQHVPLITGTSPSGASVSVRSDSGAPQSDRAIHSASLPPQRSHTDPGVQSQHAYGQASEYRVLSAPELEMQRQRGLPVWNALADDSGEP